MAEYAIVLARSASKELEGLRDPLRSRVLAGIEVLDQDHLVDIIAIRHRSDVYR
jgi:mRNA-degrading endonuclease RelE of RelBE toxin-antitoxin system